MKEKKTCIYHVLFQLLENRQTACEFCRKCIHLVAQSSRSCLIYRTYGAMIAKRLCEIGLTTTFGVLFQKTFSSAFRAVLRYIILAITLRQNKQVLSYLTAYPYCQGIELRRRGIVLIVKNCFSISFDWTSIRVYLVLQALSFLLLVFVIDYFEGRTETHAPSDILFFFIS